MKIVSDTTGVAVLLILQCGGGSLIENSAVSICRV